jgi:Type IV secretory system Conjugative DNA transfer/TraM recognition site of TraD and TraG
VIEVVEILLSGLTLVVGALVLRAGSAQSGQHPSVVYELTFPSGLEAEPVVRFCSSLAGLLRPWWRRWVYQPVVVLEVVATRAGIKHRLIAPEAVAVSVEAALTAHLSSVRYQRLDDPDALPPGHLAVAAAEYRTNTNLRPLRIEQAELSAGLLSSLQPLAGHHDRVVVQWLLTPAGPVRPPRLQPKQSGPSVTLDNLSLTTAESVGALKTKQSAPLLLAACRIAVWADRPERAEQLLRHVEAPWHAARAPGVHLRRRWFTRGEVLRRVERRSIPVTTFPMVLNAEEASGLIGWPIEINSMPGLTLGTCRLLPTPGPVPRTGTLIGTSTYPASLGRPVCLGPEARTRHLWVCGPTGAGKSTLLARLAVADIIAGHGVVVLDPKGDLIEHIAARIPENRLDQVIVLDAADDAFPVGYNPLKCTEANRELVVEQCLGVMRAIWKFSWGPRLDEIVRGCLLTLTMRPGMTLAELPALLTDPNFRGRMVSGLNDPFGVEGFWASFNSWSRAEQITNVAPALNKIRAFAMRSRLRGVLGQSNGAVDFNRIIRNRQVLLVDLAAGKLGIDAAYLLGALLFAGLWDAVSARAGMPFDQRPMVCAYLDEFQHLIALPTPAETMLAEGRSYGLALTLAHQHLGQLDRELIQAMTANTRSKLIMAASHHDSADFAKELGGSLEAEDLMGIAAHEAVVACFAAGRTQPPATIALPDLPEPSGDAAQVRAESRRRFGTPRDDVDAQIATRQRGRQAAAALGRARRTRQ